MHGIQHRDHRNLAQNRKPRLETNQDGCRHAGLKTQRGDPVPADDAVHHLAEHSGECGLLPADEFAVAPHQQTFCRCADRVDNPPDDQRVRVTAFDGEPDLHPLDRIRGPGGRQGRANQDEDEERERPAGGSRARSDPARAAAARVTQKG